MSYVSSSLHGTEQHVVCIAAATLHAALFAISFDLLSAALQQLLNLCSLSMLMYVHHTSGATVSV